MGLFRAMLGLLILLMTACTVVPTAQPAVGQWAIPTRTSVLLEKTPDASKTQPGAPEPSLTDTLPVRATASPTLADAPTSTPEPNRSEPTEPSLTAALAATPLPAALAGTTVPLATPIPAALGWREPWQYYSGAVNGQGDVIYRIRYPHGWFAAAEAGGDAIFQNMPPGADDFAQAGAGAIRIDLRFAQFGQAGSLPPPNLKVLAAGKPGTRQILVDAGRGVTIWNVRLYGLNDSTTTLSLTGQLTGSRAAVETGIRLLDDMLQTLELYARPDALPAPVPPDYSPAEGWQKYGGRLQTDETSFQLFFRIPHGWWAYPYDGRFLDVTNYVADPLSTSPEPAGEGTIKLSVSAADCSTLGNCPADPLPIGNGRWRGVREVLKNPEGHTFWTVRLYYQQTQLTIFAVLVGSDEMVERGILTLNMLLRTLEIYP